MLARRCLKEASKAAKALVANFLASANATSAFEEEPPLAPSPRIPDWAIAVFVVVGLALMGACGCYFADVIRRVRGSPRRQSLGTSFGGRVGAWIRGSEMTSDGDSSISSTGPALEQLEESKEEREAAEANVAVSASAAPDHNNNNSMNSHNDDDNASVAVATPRE